MSAKPRQARARRFSRGISLIEVMVSIAILGIASLGLVGGIIVSLNSNALAARRTQALELAQARIERLMAMGPVQIVSMLSAGGVASAMATASAFDPTVLKGVANNGWMIDVLEGTAGTGMGADVMAGPILRDFSAMSAGESNITDSTTANVNYASAWVSGTYTNTCASTATTTGATGLVEGVASDPGTLCREVHVTQLCCTGITCTAQTTPCALNTITMYRVYVRVNQGGAGNLSTVLLQQDIVP